MELPEIVPWMSTTELIGLLASVLVLVSFLFKSIRTIRIISIVGCVVFVIYGLLINALSIWALNGALIIVHIYFLLRLRGQHAKGAKRTGSTRLQKFSRENFGKDGLRHKPWFVEGDLS